MKIVREGNNICPGAIKTYLSAWIEGIEQVKFLTPFPSVRWDIAEKVGDDPFGEYWVKIEYINTALRHPGYGCKQSRFARVFRSPMEGFYSLVKGAILGITLTKESYQPVASYKLLVEIPNGSIVKYSLVDTRNANGALGSNIECTYKKVSSAYPASVKITDIIPVKGGIKYDFRVFDERGLVFNRIFEKIPTIDDYCVYPQEKCPSNTCSCDCNPNYICCYGKDGIVKKLISK